MFLEFEKFLSISEELKILSIKNVTRPYCVNPVFTITREGSYGIVTDCGKGPDFKAAFCSAFFEAIERASAERFNNIHYEGLANSLRGYTFLMPSDFYESKGYADEALRKWCLGTDITSNKEILVPFESVVFPSKSDFYNETTIGLASGLNKTAAILHGIYEVIEHDTLNITLYSGLPYQELVLTPEDGILFDIHNKLRANKIDVKLLYLLNDYHIPTVLALLSSIPGMGENNVAGIGSSIDIRTATRRALTEAEQSACFWNDKYDSGNMNEAEIFHPIIELCKGYTSSKNNNLTINKTLCTTYSSTEEELTDVLSRLRNACKQIITVDITDKRIGIPVVKVLIPNFEDCLKEEFLRGRSKVIKKIVLEYSKNETKIS